MKDPQSDELVPPPDAGPAEMLRLAVWHSPEELEAAGLGSALAKATGQMKAQAERAAKLLGAKFIDPERIEQLCWAGLIGRTSFQSIYAKDLHRIAVAWEMLAAFGVEPADLLALQQEALRNAWQPKRKK